MQILLGSSDDEPAYKCIGVILQDSEGRTAGPWPLMRRLGCVELRFLQQHDHAAEAEENSVNMKKHCRGAIPTPKTADVTQRIVRWSLRWATRVDLVRCSRAIPDAVTLQAAIAALRERLSNHCAQ